MNNTCKGKKEHHEEFGRTKFVAGECEGNGKISKQRDDNDIESKGEKNWRIVCCFCIKLDE